MNARFSLTSIAFGGLSILTVYSANYYESLRGTGSSFLLNTAKNLDLVNDSPPSYIATMKAPSLLNFTDETALITLFYLGCTLAIASICLAILAEAKNESNLYLSVGFMCGIGGLLLAKPIAGIASMLAFSVVLLSLRSIRKRRPNAAPAAPQG